MVTRAELNALIKPIQVAPNEESQKQEEIVKPQRIKRVKRADYSGNGHWIFPEEMGHDGNIGFIYVIHNLTDDRLYLGKKQYVGAGKLNKGVVSNWQWYTSSSKELSADIARLGKDCFEFIAIEEYETKGSLSYAETWSLMVAEIPSNRDRWYNRLVNGVSWKCKESISDRHKERLVRIIRGESLEETINAV